MVEPWSAPDGAPAGTDLDLAAAQRRALGELVEVPPVAVDLADRFVAAGYELALVGGSVRDALLGRSDVPDLDFATDARPEQVQQLLAGWADDLWDVGIAFGTVGARRDGTNLEITTYRAEAYRAGSRKPAVTYGQSLADDLGRRDFTINALALRLPGRELVDLFGGIADLTRRRLVTPGRAEDSFADDPLRMLRAARFTAQLGLQVDPEVVSAMRAMAATLSSVSAERVRGELVKLVCAPDPRSGLELMVGTNLADVVLPELPALRLEIDEHHRHKDVYEHTLIVLEQAIELAERRGDEAPGRCDVVLRLAALLHDVGKPRTRRFEPDGRVSFHHHEVEGAKLTRARLRALHFPKETVEQVAELVELHLRFHGYSEGEWTDSAVRRYVRDAGDQLERLHVLTRADCTTRNRRKATALARAYDSLEERIAGLAEVEQLATIRPDLDGNEIMALLGVGPGPVVGRAYRFLLDRRLDRGPVDAGQARAELAEWWAAQPGSDTGSAEVRRPLPVTED
ncbi:MAG: CCA tRNA nucleotidyltransferase [Actinomycetes bacterium]